MDLHTQLRLEQTHDALEQRRHPRFKLEVDVRVYPRNRSVVRGHSVDISEAGISAILRTEVPVGEVVRLEFELPDGPVDVLATIRQKNAFRYGFQFVESSSALPVIARTCRQLAITTTLAEDKANPPRSD